jgi:hypothetical protein
MQNPQGGDIAIEPGDGNDAYRLVVSDVKSLIEHVQASLRLIEQTIARETALGGQETANVVVLDDVTPCYVRATTALNACDAHLAIALRSLLDSGTPEPGDYAWNPPAISSVSA